MELSGRHFGHIRVTEVVGQGGMGDVYAGYDEKLERKVALKVLNDDQRLDAEARERLLREARALSKLDHPNICRIHDYIETRDVDLLVLEYIDGKTLHDAMQERMAHHEKLRIAIAIADVLVQAHRAGIVHRDLKPENVMLTQSGEVKVLDFGLARWLHKSRGTRSSDRHLAVRGNVRAFGDGAETAPFSFSDAPSGPSPRRDFMATAVGITLGTPLFMSPEQARGETLTPASDMFSFGLLLQILFTGEEPHPSDLTAREVILRVARGETQPVKGAPGDVTALTNRLKQLAPADRPTAVEAAERLRVIDSKPQRVARRAIAAAAVLIALLGAWRYTVDLRRERAIAVDARAETERRRAQADDLINFMVGDLREKLEPVGRLDIMDDVAERVLAHVAAARPESLSTAEIVQNAKALNQLGEVRRNLGKSKEALSIFDESLKLANVAASRAPDDPEAQRTLLNNHFSIAAVFLASGEYPRALENFQKQLAVAERMASRHRDDASWQSELAQSHGNIGTTLERQDDFRGALEHYARSLAIKRDLLRRKPDDAAMQTEVAIATNKIGAVSFRLRRFEDARRHFESEIAIYTKLVNSDPLNTSTKRRLAVAHAFHAAVLEDEGQLDAALAERRLELNAAEQLFAHDPANVEWRANAEIAHSRMANLQRLVGDAKASIASYKRAAVLLEPLLDKDARPAWRREPVSLHYGLARAQIVAGNPAAAVAAAQKALDVAMSIGDGTATTKGEMAEALVVLSDAYDANGQPGRASDVRRQAVAVLEPLISGSSSTRTLTQWGNLLDRLGRSDEARTVARDLVRDGYRHPDCRPCKQFILGSN